MRLLSQNNVWLALWAFFLLSFGLGSIGIQLIWLLALTGLIVVARDRSNGLDLAGSQSILLPLFAVLLVSLWSLMDSVVPARSARTLVRFCSYGVAAWMLFRLAPRAEQLQPLILMVGGGVVFFWLDGLFQLVAGANLGGFPLYYDGRYADRITGFLAINYGWVMAVMSPWAFEACRLSRRPHIAYSVVLPIGCAAILFSGSRASMLLYLASLVLYGVFLGQKHGWSKMGDYFFSMLFALVVALLAGASIEALNDRWTDVHGVFSTQLEDWNYALSLRPNLWLAAGNLAVEHWLNGVGLRGFGTAASSLLAGTDLPPGDPYNWSPHLAVLEVAADLGLAGLMLYLILYYKLIRWCITCPSIAIAPALTAMLAFFPLGSTLPIWSARVAGMGWVFLAVSLVFVQAGLRPIHHGSSSSTGDTGAD